LEAIADELRQSTFCPLKETAKNTVAGEGNPNPDIVFIGEAPGQEEDQQGLPFVGPSGEILTRVISAMGLSRDEVWIGNIVKWRPPNNRAPTPEEIAGCMPYLVRQLDILKPKVIVTLGGVATKAMLDTTEGISRLRGQWKEFQGTPLMPTFHPSFLLRSQNRQQKERYWEVWSDMESVLLKLGMPSPGKKK
jgi:DNA polymerase